MNTPDLYGAWLTAGNNLQPYIGWAVAHWIWLVVAASATATIALQLRQKGDQQ